LKETANLTLNIDFVFFLDQDLKRFIVILNIFIYAFEYLITFDASTGRTFFDFVKNLFFLECESFLFLLKQFYCISYFSLVEFVLKAFLVIVFCSIVPCRAVFCEIINTKARITR
jgi:hypothetical protein